MHMVTVRGKHRKEIFHLTQGQVVVQVTTPLVGKDIEQCNNECKTGSVGLVPRDAHFVVVGGCFGLRNHLEEDLPGRKRNLNCRKDCYDTVWSVTS